MYHPRYLLDGIDVCVRLGCQEGQTFSEQEASEEFVDQSLRELFDSVCDISGEGMLDRDEVARIAMLAKGSTQLQPEQLDAAMASMDTDQNGEVDFEEFALWWQKMEEQKTKSGKIILGTTRKRTTQTDKLKEKYDEQQYWNVLVRAKLHDVADMRTRSALKMCNRRVLATRHALTQWKEACKNKDALQRNTCTLDSAGAAKQDADLFVRLVKLGLCACMIDISLLDTKTVETIFDVVRQARACTSKWGILRANRTLGSTRTDKHLRAIPLSSITS